MSTARPPTEIPDAIAKSVVEHFGNDTTAVMSYRAWQMLESLIAQGIKRALIEVGAISMPRALRVSTAPGGGIDPDWGKR